MITTKETALDFVRSILSLANDLIEDIQADNWEGASSNMDDIQTDGIKLARYISTKLKDNENV